MTTVPNILNVKVARKEVLAIDIVMFELLACGNPLPSFSAGSHVDVFLPGGITRQYSLCNNPSEVDRYQIAVLKDCGGRGGSRAMHENVFQGDMIQISAPKNHFPLEGGARQSVLLAGGIGITPLLCMAERLASIQQSFELYYFCRSPERTAFRDQLQKAAYADCVHFSFDSAPEQQRIDISAVLKTPATDVHVYVCGPKGFIEHVLGTARRIGWAESQLHYEFFSAEPLKLETDGSFEIQLASSGRLLRVAADQTVAATLEAAGIDLPTSCSQGVCGTCLTRLLSGEPDHRDFYLTAEEKMANDCFLPCCSRSKSPRLVLDL